MLVTHDLLFIYESHVNYMDIFEHKLAFFDWLKYKTNATLQALLFLSQLLHALLV